MKTIRWLTLGLLMSTPLCTALGQPQFTTPGSFRSTPKSVTHRDIERSDAEQSTSPGMGVMSMASYPEIAEASTPEIAALARGLENDPKKIFDYVHDHIRYVHYFGSKKGAQLTLLERSGNDFDQCALLVALLRAGGHSASYRFGLVYMPYEDPLYHQDFKHWLGLTKPETNVTEALDFAESLTAFRGFPYADDFDDGTDDLIFHRVWVRLTWDGYVYSLDPAFKVSEPITGISLTNAMQWSTNAFWTAVGGTGDTNYVQNLNQTNLQNKLRDYTTNLLTRVQTNSPAYSVEDVIGGSYTVSSSADPLWIGLPFTVLAYPSTVDWDYIPTNMMSSLNVTVDTTTNRWLWMPQLQGQRLSLTFSTNGLAQLWLEDDLLLQKQTSGGASVNVVLAVDHPHGTWDWNNNTLINTNWDDQVATNAYQRTNASYAITYAFEPDQEWLRQRQDRLDRYRQQGLADTSREVTTETLNVMGLNWMLQTERIPRLLATQEAILMQNHHRLGRMAQEQGKGYYIDVYAQLTGDAPASGNGASDTARGNRFFDVAMYFQSAAEHGLIEQLQATNLVAASTVKMLQIGNTLGQRTYLAQSSNWSTVRGNLSGYDTNWLKTAYIDKGYTLLLPASGTNQVAGAGSWAGYGIAARLLTTNMHSMTMLISGNYNGGYVSVPTAVVNTPYVSQSSYSQPTYFNPSPPTVVAAFGADPVNMADGSFHLSATDLSMGQSEPRGITFTRHYSSSRRFHNLAGMAPGWVHNYLVKATDVSAPLAALGETTPAQMAALAVATRAAMEIYTTNTSPKTWATTALVAKWGVDQLIGNAVSITLGKDTLQFVKQPDGVYTPPAGCTMTLAKTNGAYWLRERHGNTFKFNTSGLLTNIVDQYDKGLTVAYNASNCVSTVTDWKNRQLAFTYNGTPWRLASIADNTTPARTVSFGYTAAGGSLDLTSVTDPDNKTSTIAYDTNHQAVATLDALGRVVVSNSFDAFGRVTEQYSQGDPNKTWRLYWSGWENVEQDPSGGRKRYLYDDKHRLTHTVDPLGHWRDTYYDGQDHLVQTVSHLYAYTDYYYDARHNLATVNDPLGQWKYLFYDAQDNLVRVQDERTNNSYFGYNSKFQMTVSTNNAGEVVTYGYNAADGTLTNRTDPGGATVYGYDSYGLLNSVTYPGGLGSETLQNNAWGDLTNRVNARNVPTAFVYNARRVLTDTITAGSITNKVIFDAVGNVQSTVDPRGFVSSNAWSSTRKLLATTLPATPQGIPVTTNAYDTRDWLASTVNPLQQPTLYANDDAGRLVAVTDPLSRATRFGYDEDNRKVATTNAANEVVRQTWNLRGDLLQTTDAASRAVKHQYDGCANQTALTNRNGKVWLFQFDAANRLTNTISPLSRSLSQTWNNRGLLASVKEPSGDSATLAYDAKGRLTNRTDNVGAITYRFDANNNRTNIVEAGKTNAWTFDSFDRVSSYRDAEGNLIQYRYDNGGNLTNLVYPDGKVVTYAFDGLNRLTNVTDWASRKTTIEYDLGNRVRKITRPNGTVREMNYDSAGQLTNLMERTAAEVPITLHKFSWDSAARIASEFTAPLPHTNVPPTRTMTFDDDNKIATFNGQNVTNDLDGNLTWGPGTNATFVAYGFDARNRLLSAGGLSYGYDPSANRVAITNGASVTRLIVNPNAALSQVLIRTKAGVTNFYVYGVGLLYEVTESAGATNTLTYHYDYRGSTMALTDGSGNVTDRAEYSAYGSLTYRSGTSDTPFLFNGRYGVQTDANGLLYMRARYYNPYLCRFLNPDPAGFSGGMNLYAYADGNPVSLLDPYGLWAGVDDAIAVGAGATIGLAAQGISDLIRGNASSWQDYVAAGLGGAAAGEATLYTGPIAGAAAGGALANASRQGLNYATGVQQSFSVSSFAVETSVSAAGGAIGSAVAQQIVRPLSNASKQWIGETTSYLYNKAQGSTLVGEQVKQAFGTRTTADFVFESAAGAQYIVEAKFGMSTLTTAQRVAQQALGDAYHVERWGFDWVGRVGGNLGYGASAVANTFIGK
ncbi:MAG: RHS repeat-associated core domain-containing protein [bacterium]